MDIRPQVGPLPGERMLEKHLPLRLIQPEQPVGNANHVRPFLRFSSLREMFVLRDVDVGSDTGWSREQKS